MQNSWCKIIAVAGAPATEPLQGDSNHGAQRGTLSFLESPRPVQNLTVILAVCKRLSGSKRFWERRRLNRLQTRGILHVAEMSAALK
ncbi:hypothetical protein SRHO_G00219800 [Serrasalmus rhombeus]